MTPAGLMARLRRPESRRFVAFLAAGGAAALVNIGSRVAFEAGLRRLGVEALAYEAAVVLAYGLGMTVAFVLTKRFVFAGSGRRPHVEYGRFALVNAVALAQVWIVSVGLANVVFPAVGLVRHAEIIAHVIGVLSPVVASYHGHKRFSFA